MPPVVKVGDQDELLETSKFQYAKWPFQQFNPVQSRIFDYYDKDNNLIIATATSSGKAQPLDSLILTPTGFRPMKEIVIGQEIIGSDGKSCLITGVFPQGIKAVYEVGFSDNTSAKCCEDHLWAIQTKHDKNRKRPFRVQALKDIKHDLKTKEGHNKWRIPLVEPVDFKNDLLPLDPYVLGLLLGDGGIVHTIKFSNTDDFIIEELKKRLPKNIQVNKIPGDNCDFSIIDTGNFKPRGFIKTNLVKKILVDLGLFGKNSCEKFIPDIYKFSSFEDRLLLLQGLMDTDGELNRNVKGAPSYSTCSYRLAKDLCDIIRSFGGVVKIRKKKTYYKDKNSKKVDCKTAYRLTVNIGNIDPFRVERKQEPKRSNLSKGRNRSIDSVKYIGEQECQCISVSNSDGLYITDNYIVTHNTVCAEMVLSYEIRKRGGKGLYLVPLRALAQEKIDEWTDKDHHFHGLKISICTGDYRLTAERKAELDAADLIIMSYEMFNSRVRNLGSERSEFLKKVGTLVADEVHLLTVPKRGDHLEAGLMRFTEINKDCRLIFLSATMPNVDEIANWVSFILNSKDTVLLSSKFRPCPLNLHYEKYWDGEYTYDDNEQQKVNMALQIVEYYPDDKFLVFAHTKRTGNLMKQALTNIGVKNEFHNADLDKATRNKLEKLFKTDPTFRVIVATSTLAWGLNLPARRVIIMGVHRGLDEVATYDIMQMVGRAGRPSYDPVGDAYVLLPERTYDLHKERIRKPQLILSQMLDQQGGHHKVLAFHLVSEIHQETIKTKDDVHHWYNRSLGHFQANELDDVIVDSTIDLLKKCGAIWEEDGILTVTSIGKIASLFYYSPFDVSDLRKNFTQLFDDHKEEDDLYLATSLANLDTYRFGIVSKAEREDMSMFANTVGMKFGKGNLKESVIKIAYIYHQLLTGVTNPLFASMSRTLQFDFPRLNQVLQAIDGFTGKWNRNQWFRELQLRMNYGVQSKYLDLCRLEGIGKVRAKKLYNAGLKSLKDVVNNKSVVKKALNCSNELAQKIYENAKILSENN